MRYRLVVAVLVVLSGLGGVAQLASADQQEWETIDTNNFVIEYKDGYRSDANEVRRVVQTARDQLLTEMPDDVDVSRLEPIHVRVYPGSEWSRGDSTLYWRNRRPVRIHVQAPSDSSRGGDFLEHGLAHEYANILLWADAGERADYNYYQRNPSWFAEGLSEYYVYRTPGVRDRFPPDGVADLNETIQSGGGYFDQLAGQQYSGGHLLSMYVVDRYGERAVWSVLRSDHDSFVAAVETELGVSYLEFKAGWRDWAEEHVGGDFPETNLPDDSKAELANRVEELERTLDRRNETVADPRARLDRRNRTVSDLEVRLIRQNRTIDGLRGQLQRQNRTIAGLQNESDGVVLNVTVEPASGTAFVAGGSAVVTAADEPSDSRSLHVEHAGETYRANATGAVNVPLAVAGSQTLTVRYGDVAERVRFDVREGNASAGRSTTDGDGPGFGFVGAVVAVVLAVGTGYGVRRARSVTRR